MGLEIGKLVGRELVVREAVEETWDKLDVGQVNFLGGEEGVLVQLGKKG